MGAAPSEYDAVIADLENQMLELQNTVDTLKRLREKGSSAGEAVTPAPRRTPRRASFQIDPLPAAALSDARVAPLVHEQPRHRHRDRK